MTARAEIADALSTVTGLRGAEFRPGTLAPGHAWPQVASYERDDGQAVMVTWKVFVVLPRDEKAASKRTDELIPLLFDALEDVVFVDGIEPIALQTSGGDLFALQVNARSE